MDIPGGAGAPGGRRAVQHAVGVVVRTVAAQHAGKVEAAAATALATAT
jgi:hypothetical protein